MTWNNLFRVFIFWDHLHDISTAIPKLLKGVEIHVLPHSATWAGSVKWTLIFFSLSASFFNVFSDDVIFVSVLQGQQGYQLRSLPDIQHAAQKRNIARNHSLAKQRWTKDKKLGPAHSLTRPPPKSSTTKPTFTKKLETINGQPLRSHILRIPVSACCGYSHISCMPRTGIGSILF